MKKQAQKYKKYDQIYKIELNYLMLVLTTFTGTIHIFHFSLPVALLFSASNTDRMSDRGSLDPEKY